MEDDLEVELATEACDVDEIYEFDSATFFDFTRDESSTEKLEAERWFQTAKGYPPSRIGFWSSLPSGGSNHEFKSTAKTKFCRSSTLMKPTASMLAKQNQPIKVNVSRKISSSLIPETQASKRQKLENSHICKHVNKADHQINFTHKVSKMLFQDGVPHKSLSKEKLTPTVPREPLLRTAYRANRTRCRNDVDPVNSKSAGHRYKALPLNRKVLEAPSLFIPEKCAQTSVVFHETRETRFVTEREKHEHWRKALVDLQQEESTTKRDSDAHDTNNKVRVCLRDIDGVFQDSKQRNMVHVGNQRTPNMPPIELFSKLSLRSELQCGSGSHLQCPPSRSASIKGSKENISQYLQMHEVT